jgi:hypothetical protein
MIHLTHGYNITYGSNVQTKPGLAYAMEIFLFCFYFCTASGTIMFAVATVTTIS